jgi:transcriptional regulator with XRE-family HTH domain
MTAARLLGEVLARAREMVGRSPEQVGDQTGVNGRTIRRLEDGGSRRPRRTTLQALAGFYGLDAEFLTLLAEWSAEGAEGEWLEGLVLGVARREIGEPAIAELDDGEEGNLLFAVTMRLSRRRGSLSGGSYHGGVSLPSPEEEEVAGIVELIAGLDRRRRRMVIDLLMELRRGQAAEQTVRRRDRLRIGVQHPLAARVPSQPSDDAEVSASGPRRDQGGASTA